MESKQPESFGCRDIKDSQIMLAWLAKHPSIWASYIANRTSHIHSLVGAEN